VAGFKAWLELSRCTRKGARGIPILVTIRATRRDDEGEETGNGGSSSARAMATRQ
jgi:hypothetical protein